MSPNIYTQVTMRFQGIISLYGGWRERLISVAARDSSLWRERGLAVEKSHNIWSTIGLILI